MDPEAGKPCLIPHHSEKKGPTLKLYYGTFTATALTDTELIVQMQPGDYPQLFVPFPASEGLSFHSFNYTNQDPWTGVPYFAVKAANSTSSDIAVNWQVLVGSEQVAFIEYEGP